jgi:hypothetical protein
MSRIEQIIGRGVRNLSHCGLDFEKRNVEIYLHATLPNDDEEPADLYVYRFAEKKAQQIGIVTRLMKETAVDCLLNVGQSNFTIDKLTALAQNRDINIELSSKGNVLVAFKIGDKPFTQVCDYMDNCAFTCSPNAIIDETEIISDTYNNDFLKMNYSGIVKRIRDLFRERTVYNRNELISSINIIKTYPTSHIDYALSRFVDNKNEYVFDRWGRTGYLVNREQYYAFQPVEITDETISLYQRSLPIDHKREYIELDLPKEKAPLLVYETESGEPLVIEDKEENITEKYKNIIEQLDNSLETVKNWRVKKVNKEKMSTGETDWYMNTGFIFDVIIENHGINESDLFEYVIYHFLDILSTEDRMILVKYIFSLSNESIQLNYQKEIRQYFEPKIIKVRGFRTIVFVSDKLVESSDERFKIFIQDEEDPIVWNIALPTDRISALKAIIPLVSVQPANLSRLVGFMQVFRNNDVVFKTMDMQNKLKKGSRCGGEGKKDVMKKINIINENVFKYTEENTEDKNLIVKPGMCIILEMLLRSFNKIGKDGKVWFLDLEYAVLNKLVK